MKIKEAIAIGGIALVGAGAVQYSNYLDRVQLTGCKKICRFKEAAVLMNTCHCKWEGGWVKVATHVETFGKP